MSEGAGLDLARPFHPARLRIYGGAAALMTLVFLVSTIGVGTGVLRPTYRLDVIANLLLAIPILCLPWVTFWNAPGERRDPLEKASEFSLVFIALSMSSQLSYELVFVIGHPLGWWDRSGDPGWTWLWWQYAQTDARYTSDNPFSFAMEVTAVLSGVLLAVAFRHLIDPTVPDLKRVRHVWLAFTGCAAITATTLTYLVSEARNGFDDIGQGTVYGLVFKFLVMNGVFVAIPLLALVALAQQIGHLERRIGAAAITLIPQKESVV